MNLQTHIERNLWLAISNTYEAQNYAHAVLDTMHYLTNVLREKAGVDGDGVGLVGQALGGNSPRLRINKLQTESDRDIQRGIEHMLRGLYTAIRNPRSHEQIDDSKDTADAIIFFVNYLLKTLDQSEEPFTIPKFLERAFDADFVPMQRYADLLAAQIPATKQTDTIIETYRNRHKGDGAKLSYVVRAILKVISDDQLSRFISVVSDDLATADTAAIGSALQILPPDLWPRIDEIAKLRVEHMLLQSMDTGRYDPLSDETTAGALGAWASGFLKHFQLQINARQVLFRMLESQDLCRRAYAARFFLTALPDVFKEAYFRQRCVRAISAAVREQDPEMRYQLPRNFWSFPKDWRQGILSSLQDLAESDPEFLNSFEDIPF